MESLSFIKTLNHAIPSLPISSRPPSSFSPKSLNLKPSFPKTLTLIRASHRSPTPKTLESISFLLKPAIFSLTAAAAVFLSRHSLPSHATVVHTPPATQSETLPSSDEHSEQVLEQHLASHPGDVDSLRALVQLKVKHHKLPEAIEVVDQLILLDPSDPGLHLLRAHLHTYIGDTEKARQGFEQILSESPFVVEAYHGLVMAATHSRDMKQLDGIVERVEGVMQRCKKENKRRELRDLKLLLGQVWIIEGKYQEALKMYQEMVKEEPRDFRPYLCQGIVYTLMKKMEEADKNFKQYRKLVPKNHPYAQLFENNLSGISAAIKRKDDNVKAAIGIVVRDDKGSVLLAFGHSLEHWDNGQVELHAILSLQKITQPFMLDAKGIILEGDNSNVICLVQSLFQKRSWEPYKHLDVDLSFLFAFKQVLFTHVTRNRNKIAHFCASFALHFSLMGHFFDPFSEDLSFLAREDLERNVTT